MKKSYLDRIEGPQSSSLQGATMDDGMNAIEEYLATYDSHLDEAREHFEAGYAAIGWTYMNAAHVIRGWLHNNGVDVAELTEFAAHWDLRSGVESGLADGPARMEMEGTRG